MYGNGYQSGYRNISVLNAPDERYAMNYPVAPGNTVIFRDDRGGYIYVKSSGMSPYDPISFERYRRDDAPVQGWQNAPAATDAAAPASNAGYARQADLEAVAGQVGALKDELSALRARLTDNENRGGGEQ